MPFIRIFGLLNAFVVENARQRRELEQHEHVSPELSLQGGLVHRVLAPAFRQDIGLHAAELPVPASLSRVADNGFGADALPIHSGEIYKMATYVAGGDPREDIEVIVQRWLARRFKPRYEASAGERAAARMIGGRHRRGPLTAWSRMGAGRWNQAKARLASCVPAELHVAYAPAVVLPYIVQCLERMRQLARDSAMSGCLSPEATVACCLASPRFAFRTCTTDVEVSFGDRPLPANTLVVLPARRLGAFASASMATAADDADRSPALRLVRRLLTRVWIESREVHHPVAVRAALRQPAVRQVPVEQAPVQHDLVLPRPVPVRGPGSLTRTPPFGNVAGRQLRRDEQRRIAQAAERSELGQPLTAADRRATP